MGDAAKKRAHSHWVRSQRAKGNFSNSHSENEILKLSIPPANAGEGREAKILADKTIIRRKRARTKSNCSQAPALDALTEKYIVNSEPRTVSWSKSPSGPLPLTTLKVVGKVVDCALSKLNENPMLEGEKSKRRRRRVRTRLRKPRVDTPVTEPMPPSDERDSKFSIREVDTKTLIGDINTILDKVEGMVENVKFEKLKEKDWIKDQCEVAKVEKLQPVSIQIPEVQKLEEPGTPTHYRSHMDNIILYPDILDISELQAKPMSPLAERSIESETEEDAGSSIRLSGRTLPSELKGWAAANPDSTIEPHLQMQWFGSGCTGDSESESETPRNKYEESLTVLLYEL